MRELSQQLPTDLSLNFSVASALRGVMAWVHAEKVCYSGGREEAMRLALQKGKDYAGVSGRVGAS